MDKIKNATIFMLSLSVFILSLLSFSLSLTPKDIKETLNNLATFIHSFMEQ